MTLLYLHLTLLYTVIALILTSSNFKTSIGTLSPLSSASASKFYYVEGIMAAAVLRLMIPHPPPPVTTTLFPSLIWSIFDPSRFSLSGYLGTAIFYTLDGAINYLLIWRRYRLCTRRICVKFPPPGVLILILVIVRHRPSPLLCISELSLLPHFVLDQDIRP